MAQQNNEGVSKFSYGSPSLQINRLRMRYFSGGCYFLCFARTFDSHGEKNEL
jgi:hypothetical protein